MPERRAHGDRRLISRMTGTHRADHPVVVGYHGTDSSRRALAYAAGTAWRLQCPMLVVYVLPAVRVAPVTGQVIRPTGDRHETVRWLTAELDEVLGRDCREAGVCLRQGNPARELAAAAREHHADALVLGVYRSWWHGAARSFPERLARLAACPVIVVP
jgi:nucleotide-binding universal stress UspA family protein